MTCPTVLQVYKLSKNLTGGGWVGRVGVLLNYRRIMIQFVNLKSVKPINSGDMSNVVSIFQGQDDEEYPAFIYDKDTPQSEIDEAYAEMGITINKDQNLPWRWNK